MPKTHWTLHDEEAVDPAPTGSDHMVMGELRSRAVRAVRQMPKPMRRVFLLRWHRLDYPEIAERLGIGQATARKYYSDARRLVTAAILVSACFLMAMRTTMPMTPVQMSPVTPTPVLPSKVAVTHVVLPSESGISAPIAELTIEEAVELLDQLLD